MNKQRGLLGKTLVVGVIVLFIGGGIQPACANSSVKEKLEVDSDNEFSLIPLKNRRIIYVDDDNTEGPWDGTLDHPYQHIQDAVDIVITGDTIFVFNGVYDERIKIIKDFQIEFYLLGEDKENTHINGKFYLYYNKGSIIVEGFTFLLDVIINAGPMQGALIKNNIMYGNLKIIDTNKIRIENNIFKNGHLMLRRTEASVLMNNSFKKGGIFFSQSSLAQEWVTNIIENNTINGKQIRFYKSSENIIVPEDTGQLIIVNCKGFTISNLVIENVEYGIQLAWSSYNKILNCIINNASSEEGDQYNPTGILSYYSQKNLFSKCIIKNFYYGIYFEGGDFNIISNNLISDGRSGIILFSSYNNLVKNNTVKNHSLCGIFLWWAKNNLVYRNIVSYNEYGICLCGEEGSIVLKNHIISNTGYGVYINVCFSYQSRCSFKIIKNNFIDNNISAYLIFSRGLWFKNYWDCPSFFPVKINGDTEFFLVWYYISGDIPYFIPRPPSIKFKRLYDYDLFPAKEPYSI